MFAKLQRIHFVGIGGIGMSGIAEVLLNLGYRVSGSDLKRSAVTDRLASLGAMIFEGHRAENVPGSEVVVISSAIARENPEVAAARTAHIPVIQRAEMLAELMRIKYGIAIAGMHGKTTTTSMVAAVLSAAGLDPTVLVGGRVEAMGSNARLGRSQYLVAEADESDRSFLKLSPIISVVTNIDREHMDCYVDMDDVDSAFIEFCERVPFYGMNVLCADDARLRSIAPRISRRVVTYGASPDADFHLHSVGRGEDSQHFSITYRGKALGDFGLAVPGMHNVLNATAAIAVGTGLDIPAAKIAAALREFRGVDRRFQFRGCAGGITIIDDYGHHPTEIRATLSAARERSRGKVHVIFQPHRYTRTRDLMSDFASAFHDADSLAVLDIYAASEPPLAGITGESLADAIAAEQRSHRHEHSTAVRYCASFEDAVEWTLCNARAGDMILTLGAGNVVQIGPMLLESLSRPAQRRAIVE